MYEERWSACVICSLCCRWSFNVHECFLLMGSHFDEGSSVAVMVVAEASGWRAVEAAGGMAALAAAVPQRSGDSHWSPRKWPHGFHCVADFVMWISESVVLSAASLIVNMEAYDVSSVYLSLRCSWLVEIAWEWHSTSKVTEVWQWISTGICFWQLSLTSVF